MTTIPSPPPQVEWSSRLLEQRLRTPPAPPSESRYCRSQRGTRREKKPPRKVSSLGVLALLCYVVWHFRAINATPKAALGARLRAQNATTVSLTVCNVTRKGGSQSNAAGGAAMSFSTRRSRHRGSAESPSRHPIHRSLRSIHRLRNSDRPREDQALVLQGLRAEIQEQADSVTGPQVAAFPGGWHQVLDA